MSRIPARAAGPSLTRSSWECPLPSSRCRCSSGCAPAIPIHFPTSCSPPCAISSADTRSKPSESIVSCARRLRRNLRLVSADGGAVLGPQPPKYAGGNDGERGEPQQRQMYSMDHLRCAGMQTIRNEQGGGQRGGGY